MLICVSSRMASWDLPSGLGSGLLWQMVSLWGFPGGSAVKNPLHWRRHGKCGFDPWVGTIPWRGNGNPLIVSLPRKVPWTEEPCGLWSLGSKRVGQDWATEHWWFHFTCEHETSGSVEGQCASLAGITLSVEVLGGQGYSFHKFMACSLFFFSCWKCVFIWLWASCLPWILNYCPGAVPWP